MFLLRSENVHYKSWVLGYDELSKETQWLKMMKIQSGRSEP